MFFETYVRLCNKVGMAPSRVAQAVGLNKASVTMWKNGARPSFKTLVSLSDYFGVSVGELLGATEETAPEIAKKYRLSVDLLLTGAEKG